jgi:hypothetical protein
MIFSALAFTRGPRRVVEPGMATLGHKRSVRAASGAEPALIDPRIPQLAQDFSIPHLPGRASASAPDIASDRGEIRQARRSQVIYSERLWRGGVFAADAIETYSGRTLPVTVNRRISGRLPTARTCRISYTTAPNATSPPVAGLGQTRSYSVST